MFCVRQACRGKLGTFATKKKRQAAEIKTRMVTNNPIPKSWAYIHWGFTCNAFKLLSPKIASSLRKWSVDLNKEIIPPILISWEGYRSQPPEELDGVSYAELIVGLFSGYQLRWQVA